MPAGSAALQSRSFFRLPHFSSGYGEPRSQPLDTIEKVIRSQGDAFDAQSVVQRLFKRCSVLVGTTTQS